MSTGENTGVRLKEVKKGQDPPLAAATVTSLNSILSEEPHHFAAFNGIVCRISLSCLKFISLSASQYFLNWIQAASMHTSFIALSFNS